MIDDVMPIKELKDLIRDFIRERKWDKYHHPKELAMSIAIEVGELMEIFQWDDKKDIQSIKEDKETMYRITEEVADVMMYILSMANKLDIDLSEAILTKLKKNRIKYDKDMVFETGAYRKDKL